MIVLEVEKYCHNCPAFEAETIDTSTLNGANFLITCKYCVVCSRIKEHLKNNV